MKLPRVSILAIMAAVIVIAVDCMAVRIVEERIGVVEWLLLIVWGTLPMTNLLAIGLASRLGRRSCGPFLAGFLLCGSNALAATVALIWLQSSWVMYHVETSVAPLLSGINPDASPVLMAILQFVAFSALFLLPQLLFAPDRGRRMPDLDRSAASRRDRAAHRAPVPPAPGPVAARHHPCGRP